MAYKDTATKQAAWKKWYAANKERISQKNREARKDPEVQKVLCEKSNQYYAANKETLRVENAKRWKDNSYNENRLPYSQWSREEKDAWNETLRNKYKTDVNFKLRQKIRATLNSRLRPCGGVKRKSSLEMLGCSIPELRIHLESQFQSGMGWGNYGQWHIDHKKALATFDLTILDQQLEACHYTNLQPLWAAQNLSKGKK